MCDELSVLELYAIDVNLDSFLLVHTCLRVIPYSHKQRWMPAANCSLKFADAVEEVSPCVRC